MLRFLLGPLVLAGLALLPALGRADELPVPRPVFAPVLAPPLLAPPVYPRRSAYEVWQYYAVDRQGYFQPRVIYLPGNRAFYAFDGKPFPWAAVYPLEFTPGVQGTPYRNYMPYARD